MIRKTKIIATIGPATSSLIMLKKIIKACEYAHSLGIQVNAGHGLTLENTSAIAKIDSIVELNIGHSIISRALFVGLALATSEMKALILKARGL